MANEVDYNPCKYLGNGSTVEFSFNWKIFNVEDLIVQLEDVSTGEQITKSYGSDYTAIFNETGGHITFNTAPTASYYVLITRNVSDYQGKRYSTSTGFQGSEVEKSFDRVSCNLQEVEYTLQRAIKVPVGSSILDLTLPLPDAGKTLKWNESETGLVNSTIDVDELESIANRLHESIDNIDTVADNILDVNDVADIQEDVTKVANNETNINKVANNETNINKVANNETNINTVANDKANIDIVAAHIDNVDSAESYRNQTQQIYEQTQTLVGADYNRVYDTLINIDNKATNAATSAVSATQSASVATLRAEEANLYAQTAGASATTATNAADLLSDIYEAVIDDGHITVPSIDTTLSVSGAAADAASVGKYTDKLDVYGSSTTYTNTATSSINPAYTWFLYFEDDMYVKSWTPVITSAYITYRFAKSATDVADDVDIVYTSDTYTAKEGDTISVNRILGKRSFIVITGGEIKYTANGQSYNIKAHLASLTSGNKAEMVTSLANDYHSGTFIFEDRFDNIPTKTEVDNISNKLTTYGKTLTYTNTANAATQGSAYWILFFDDSKYVKSWTPELAEGSHIYVSFGKTNEDIADNVQGTIIGPPIILGCGDTLNINRYMTPHDFLFISGNPKYTSSVIPFSINARIAASDITGKFSMVSGLKYDHHAGTFVLEDRFDNVATLKDVNTISNELNNYGQVISYTNTKNADTDGSAWFALYFDYETYVKSWTPSYDGSSIQYAFATSSIDIADGATLQIENVYTAASDETINIERYFTKKDCLLVKGYIGYGWGQYQNAAINARLALYANSTIDCSNFASNVFAGTFELSQQIYKGLPTVSFVEQRIKDSEKNSSKIYPCSMSLFSNFGVIGDSYGCGQAWTQGGTLVNGYEQSWEKILGRMTGATVYPFCISGSTTASWLANGGEHGLVGLLAAPPLQLYILGHVINDANVGLTIGDISDIEDVSDPTSLPSTFVNNMAKIRYYCLQHSPNAKIIFMLSDGYTYNNIDKSAYDAATIQVANYYNTPYINQHDHPYYAMDVYKNLTSGHPTVQGYAVMAKAIRDLVEECMGKSTYTNYFNTALQT